ncbi:MAG: hypothetical protein H7249_17880 [Chitinophagaceae bacterium]|nr:hypothetical protein [Oligoflexus sp.]
MKHLTAFAILSVLAAGSMTYTARATPASPLGHVADPSNSDQILQDQLKAYTAPLPVDAKAFGDYARSEIEKTFGTSRDGKIIFQDALIVNGDGRWNDFARLYYVAKVNSNLLESDSTFATFYIQTNGTSSLGLASFESSAQSLSLLFPGWMITYKSDVSLSDMDTLIGELESKHPDILIERPSAHLLPRMISVHPKHTFTDTDGHAGAGKAVENLSRSAILDLQDFKASITGDSRIESVEVDSEVRNPGLTARAIDLGAGTQPKTIDLNALRSVTIKELKDGAPSVTKPSLPAPFGK